MKPTIAVFLIIMFASFACADVIGDIKIDIRADGYARVDKTIVFQNQGEFGTVVLPDSVEDIIAKDSLGELPNNFTLLNGEKIVKIFFRDYQEVGQSNEVHIEYGTHYITKKEGDVWTFEFATESTPRKTIIKTSFPTGTRILSLKPEDMLRSYVENGIWVYPQMDYFNFTSTYQHDSTAIEVNQTGVVEDNTNPGILEQIDVRTLYGIVLALVVFIMAGIVYTLYKNKMLHGVGGGRAIEVNIADDIVSEANVDESEITYNLKTPDAPVGDKTVKDSITKMLNENELAIVNLLQQAKGEEITQAYIHKTIGIPKSSLSDILKQMEKRNILERQIQGRVKWIKLKNWIFE